MKPVYLIKDVQFVNSFTLFPTKEENKQKWHAYGERYSEDGVLEGTVRTSTILNVDIKTGDIETMNSIYRMIL